MRAAGTHRRKAALHSQKQRNVPQNPRPNPHEKFEAASLPTCTNNGQLMPLSIRRMFSASSGGGMPTYEFFCHACAKPFSKTLNLKEYEEGTVACPDCGSDDVEQRLSSFYAVTSKKSA
jgi:putative FmdB family regulatory protein